MKPAEKRNTMRGKYFAAALDVANHVTAHQDDDAWGVGMTRILRINLYDTWLTNLLDAHPVLDATGYGSDCGKDEGARHALARDVDGVVRSIGWLAVQSWHTTMAVDCYVSSYTLKHRAERATGAYISNGAMCAAALLLGPAGLHLSLAGARRNPVIGVKLDG